MNSTSNSNCRNDPILLPEIIGQIIDHLHQDKRSLKACTLVCYHWLPAARFHLFDFLDASFCFRDRITKFLKEYPYLSSYVRRISLDTRARSLNEIWGWRITSLGPVISNFKNLTQWDIQFLDPFLYLGFVRTETNFPVSPVSPDEFPNLKTLSLCLYLSNTNLAAYTYVMNWFLSLPCLENLTVRDFMNGSLSLKGGDPDPEMIFNMIPSGGVNPQNPVYIKNLHLRCDFFPVVHILIAPILSRLDADALKTLTFSFTAFLPKDPDESELDPDDGLGFRKLQTYLTRRPFPRIERVVLRGHVGEADVRNFLEARFEVFEKQGILVFDTTPCY